MKPFWLIFSQTVTLCLAVFFVVLTLKPQWLPGYTANPPLVIKRAVKKEIPATSGPVSYAAAAQKAGPSVVHIFTRKKVQRPLFNDPLFRHFFGDLGKREELQSGLGSGVIVSRDGYILTNNHVVDSADAIQVAELSGEKHLARLIGTDPESDLAVLKIQTDLALQAISLAADDSLQVGDIVLAIGNPFGVGRTVTAGIVSALGRNHLGINTFENYIQTDAAINPGNSGGALINVHGDLVGINTAIYSKSGGSMGIGFAIPIALASDIMRQIVRDGHVTRGWAGLETQDLSPHVISALRLKRTMGAIITAVVRNGPAHSAGILPGDVLVAVGQQPVHDSAAALRAISKMAPDDVIEFTLIRRGRRFSATVTIGQRPLPGVG